MYTYTSDVLKCILFEVDIEKLSKRTDILHNKNTMS